LPDGEIDTVRCLLALKAVLAGLAEEDRELIRPILEASGAWDALQFAPGEEAYVVPIEMA
jgi:hypothetical protein